MHPRREPLDDQESREKLLFHKQTTPSFSPEKMSMSSSEVALDATQCRMFSCFLDNK
jgi:hypothetical protein